MMSFFCDLLAYITAYENLLGRQNQQQLIQFHLSS